MSISIQIFILFCATFQNISCAMKCPQGITRFSAYPEVNIKDAGYYYDCSRTAFAVLKRCRSGAFYDSELETCRMFKKGNLVSNRSFKIRSKGQKRCKRNTDNDMKEYLSKKGVKTHAKQPALGRPVKLGALYYGKEERIAFDENLWKDRTIKNNSTFINVTSSRAKIRVTQDVLDRLDLFGIKAEILLGLMRGKLEIGGSAEFLRNGRKTTKSVSVSLLYESVRYQQSISQEMRVQVDYAELCKEVNKEDGPTHIVSSITRGMNAVFEFQTKTDNEKNNDVIGGSLTIKFQAFPIGIGGTADFKMKSEESKLFEETDIFFFGDTVLDKVPTDINEAKEAIKTLSKLAQNSTAIISYEISPITKYCDETTTFLKSLNDKIYVQVKLIINSSAESTECLIRTQRSISTNARTV